MGVKQPTAEQCEANARMEDVDGCLAYACWYPQMGGYVGKCVVVVTPGVEDSCFEAYVWHRGDFPFNEDDGIPAHIHHCMPSQFIEFGEWVQKLQEGGDGTVPGA